MKWTTCLDQKYSRLSGWNHPNHPGEWCLCRSKERLWNQSFNLTTVRFQQGDRTGVPHLMLLLVLSTRISPLQYITKKENNHGETFYFICIVMCFWVLTTSAKMYSQKCRLKKSAASSIFLLLLSMISHMQMYCKTTIWENDGQNLTLL